MAQFSVANGQIIDPSGNVFIARGINVFLNQTDASTILSTFPGINAVRLATTPSADPASLDKLVQGLTSKGVVVELEDHSSSGGNPNTSEGAALTAETIWYAGLAKQYANNPYVWFGTANEPDNQANLQAIPNQEKAIYDAIRATGNQNPLMLELRGGFTQDANRASAGSFANMHNVVWDTHFYDGGGTGTTDVKTISDILSKQIADAQSVQSADGVVPVILGEYGPSITGNYPYDTDWKQTLQAVQSSGSGSLAWAWNAGSDALTDNSGLTPFGQEVAQYIGSSPSAPAPNPPPAPAPQPAPASAPTPTPPVPGGISPGQGSFTDAAGNVYTIDVSSNAVENSQAMANGSETAAMTYADGKVYGEDATSHSWYTWDQTSWTAASAPPSYAGIWMTP